MKPKCLTVGCCRMSEKDGKCHSCYQSSWAETRRKDAEARRLFLLRIAPPLPVPALKPPADILPHELLYDPREGLPVREVRREDVRHGGSIFVPRLP